LNYLRASRELKFQEELYELLVKQYEGSKIDEAQEAPVVQVIEPAILPERKSGPKRSLIVLGALLLGLFVGMLRVLYSGWRSGLNESQMAAWAEMHRAAFRWSA
jgi:uncharacterized protein involved in exopolysaccharide biosynthesis